MDSIRIIHGGAKGVDSLIAAWALAREVPVVAFPAEWERLGRIAGPLRNAQMLDKADIVVAFPGGKGTLNTITQAFQREIPIWFVGGIA